MVVFTPEDEEFCLAVLHCLRDIFKTVTGVSCATCIKAYIPNRKVLVTISRDCISAAERGLIDQQRPFSAIGENTASVHVIQNKGPYFFCNNLLESVKRDEYQNERPNWELSYISTIVWPIRKFDPTTKSSHIFGLLCVDAKKVDVFDKDVCIQIGAIVADMIYPYFRRIDPENIWKQIGDQR
jgi:hypothetical protein